MEPVLYFPFANCDESLICFECILKMAHGTPFPLLKWALGMSISSFAILAQWSPGEKSLLKITPDPSWQIWVRTAVAPKRRAPFPVRGRRYLSWQIYFAQQPKLPKVDFLEPNPIGVPLALQPHCRWWMLQKGCKALYLLRDTPSGGGEASQPWAAPGRCPGGVLHSEYTCWAAGKHFGVQKAGERQNWVKGRLVKNWF